MDKFFALSTPIRREIVGLLSGGKRLTSSAIADHFQVSAPAISQHLKILLNSHILSMHKEAQQRIYELNPLALKELEDWAKSMMKTIDGLSNLSGQEHEQTAKE